MGYHKHTLLCSVHRSHSSGDLPLLACVHVRGDVSNRSWQIGACNQTSQLHTATRRCQMGKLVPTSTPQKPCLSPRLVPRAREPMRPALAAPAVRLEAARLQVGGEPRLQHKETALHGRHRDHAVPVPGVAAPRAAKARSAAGGLHVEEAKLLEAWTLARPVLHLHHTKTCAVVRFEDQATVNIQVVINGRLPRVVIVYKSGVAQILHVPQQGTGVVAGPMRPLWIRVHLVQLVVQEEVLLLLIQPTLMHVTRVLVAHTSNLSGLTRVSNIHNGQSILIVAETDLPATVLSVRALVDLALGIVGIPVGGVTAQELGILWG
mmetsp:Transcript_102059/g.304564  ORF Transcript_102059/g.304564 Transcript_102059/m.304564 type:complete len:320 (-) Transcript_102059:1214-2173(-)